MKKKSINFVRWLGVILVATGTFSSCIREALPDLNLDIKDIQPTLGVNGTGIVKSTVQENGVTLYADMTRANLSNLDLDVTVSDGAKWSFVDVTITKTPYTKEYGGQTYNLTRVDTVVNGEIAAPKDFTETRYIKVVSAREGVNEDDTLTQHLINIQNSGFIGWDNNGKMSKTYTPGAHLYKIWTVNTLPAGIPTTLTFDNWSDVMGSKYELPYEIMNGNRSNIWSSTNPSIALMAATNPLIQFGAQSTTDVAPVRGSENKKALLLTSNDIRYTQTKARPFLAGCCFVGEYDGTDNGALTCTHVGLPFNKAPESLSFWYKYLPLTIQDPNTMGYSGFNVPDILNYVGKKDKGFILAVLYRADGDYKWLNGETIRSFIEDDIIAYSLFVPEEQTTYTQQTIPFTYVHDINADDLNNWKYNLAIYFASSYDGFRFICGANMADAYQGKQGGSQLYIDEMEINCK